MTADEFLVWRLDRRAGAEVRQPPRADGRMVVQCGDGSGKDLEATDPIALFEVLSPSTRRFDRVLKANLRTLDASAAMAELYSKVKVIPA